MDFIQQQINMSCDKITLTSKDLSNQKPLLDSIKVKDNELIVDINYFESIHILFCVKYRTPIPFIGRENNEGVLITMDKPDNIDNIIHDAMKNCVSDNMTKHECYTKMVGTDGLMEKITRAAGKLYKKNFSGSVPNNVEQFFGLLEKCAIERQSTFDPKPVLNQYRKLKAHVISGKPILLSEESQKNILELYLSALQHTQQSLGFTMTFSKGDWNDPYAYPSTKTLLDFMNRASSCGKHPLFKRLYTTLSLSVPFPKSLDRNNEKFVRDLCHFYYIISSTKHMMFYHDQHYLKIMGKEFVLTGPTFLQKVVNWKVSSGYTNDVVFVPKLIHNRKTRDVVISKVKTDLGISFFVNEPIENSKHTLYLIGIDMGSANPLSDSNRQILKDFREQTQNTVLVLINNNRWRDIDLPQSNYTVDGKQTDVVLNMLFGGSGQQKFIEEARRTIGEYRNLLRRHRVENWSKPTTHLFSLGLQSAQYVLTKMLGLTFLPVKTVIAIFDSMWAIFASFPIHLKSFVQSMLKSEKLESSAMKRFLEYIDSKLPEQTDATPMSDRLGVYLIKALKKMNVMLMIPFNLIARVVSTIVHHLVALYQSIVLFIPLNQSRLQLDNHELAKKLLRKYVSAEYNDDDGTLTQSLISLYVSMYVLFEAPTTRLISIFGKVLDMIPKKPTSVVFIDNTKDLVMSKFITKFIQNGLNLDPAVCLVKEPVLGKLNFIFCLLGHRAQYAKGETEKQAKEYRAKTNHASIYIALSTVKYNSDQIVNLESGYVYERVDEYRGRKYETAETPLFERNDFRMSKFHNYFHNINYLSGLDAVRNVEHIKRIKQSVLRFQETQDEFSKYKFVVPEGYYDEDWYKSNDPLKNQTQ
jgi:hypothetical protein